MNPPQETNQDTKDSSGMSSIDNSRPGSRGRDRPKKRVGFSGGVDPVESRILGEPIRALSPPTLGSGGRSPTDSGATNTPVHSRQGSGDTLLPRIDNRSHLPELSPQLSKEIHEAFGKSLSVPKPRPAMRRGGSNHSVRSEDLEDEAPEDERERSYRELRAQEAFERGKRLERDERIQSEPNSRHTSPSRAGHIHFAQGRPPPLQMGDIPLVDMSDKLPPGDETEDDDHDMPSLQRGRKMSTAEAHKLVRKHTQGNAVFHTEADGTRSGAVTPIEEQAPDYVPQPDQYRGGILGALLKLYGQPGHQGSHSRSSSIPRAAHLRHSSADTSFSNTPTPQYSPPTSGTTTPNGSKSLRHWYGPKHSNQSSSSLAQLVGSSASLSSPVVSGLGEQVSQRLQEQAKRPGVGKRSRSSGTMAALARMSRPRLEDEIRITVHIAETIQRQKYLMKLCRALMEYGAPTHRLEEYMKMSARVLEIESQFLYIPGSMIISFDDSSTHTTEVKLVRIAQGLDLGKLHDVHDIYKDVVHDRIGVEEATQRLDEVTRRKIKHSNWARVPIYGLAAVSVGPFAFGARFIDLPIAFVLGCILGILQLIIAPKSDLYANVFEISASVITSFLARAAGSIRGGDLFCFSALAQSSIALILPGYIVLCASLELQSRSIVAGSVRMVYAIIYSLFLGFGITIGTAIYGIIDKNATSATSCKNPMKHHWFFVFVPCFAMCLIIINQSKWKQAPVMVFIAFGGYCVSYFSSQRFAGNTQVSSTLGALAIGVMANLYSRIGQQIENWFLDVWEDKLRPKVKAFRKRVLHLRTSRGRTPKVLEEGSTAGDAESIFVRRTRKVGYGLAAAAMLPAIFVQVPSGLAVSGSLVSGIASANQITGNATNGTTVVNSTTLVLGSEGLNNIAFNVGYSVIQVAIGITVGLFLSAVIVYPFGKKRSGLFSF